MCIRTACPATGASLPGRKYWTSFSASHPPTLHAPQPWELLGPWGLSVVTGSQMPVLTSSAVFSSSWGSHGPTQVGRGKSVAEAQSHWGLEASKPHRTGLGLGQAGESRAAAPRGVQGGRDPHLDP